MPELCTPVHAAGRLAALCPVLCLCLCLTLWGCGSKEPGIRTSGPGVDKPYKQNGKWYYPMSPAEAEGYEKVGRASWYGPGFHGKPTSSGERFNQNDMTAAHTVLPFQSRVEVTNLDNGRRVVVRINDRGPFAGNRIIDLSKAAAQQLGMIGPGTARVRLRHVGAAGTASTSPAVSRPQPAQRPSVQGTFYIQVGAFGQESNARKAVRRAEKLDMDARVVRTQRGLWRVIYGPWRDLDTANDHLWQVRSSYPGAFVTSDGE